ncbi:PEP-CTERM sorting domain-containing protein [Massilia consociata]|uniref:PEP-CTERM sorting domain-containing protein n=1 Tax=Massilia consociata TaxID=760117 RepID=A0ABV6FF36_9BURK
MKNKLVALTLGFAAFGTAQAAVQTYDFTASVTWLGDATTYTYPNPLESWSPGISIRLEDKLTGRLSFDDAAKASEWSTGWFMSPGSVQFSFTGKDLQYAFTTNGISVENGIWGYDAVSFFANSGNNASLTFMDQSATALESLTIPSVLSLAAFPQSGIHMSWTNPSNRHYVMMSARLDSLVAQAAVPEPGSMGIVLAGLVMAGAIGARRSRQT